MIEVSNIKYFSPFHIYMHSNHVVIIISLSFSPPYSHILLDSPAIRELRTVIDKVFIHLAKRSGMCDREDFTRRIDLKGKALDTGIKDELIEIFKPKENEGFLTYVEFLNGIR